jgi:DNA-binding NtrC family response regulator|uniref:Response regulator n=1 Tax=Desulfobacca acetoxidans TaxID=60893 RepID=A0A7V6A525_9BACT
MRTLSSASYSQYRGRILVVDQDDWCREFLSQVIKLCGIGEFHLARSAEEASSLLEQLPFDLLITDLNLPQYHQMLEDIRQRFPGMRLIVMIHQRSQMQHVLQLDQVEIVIKPLSLDEMARKIREIFHSKHRLKIEEEILRLKREAFRI